MTPTTVAPALQDLPIPRRANSIVEMSREDALKHTIQMIFMALCCLVPAFFLWRSGYQGWGGVLGVLGVILFISSFTKKALIAPCPFCSTGVYGIVAGKTKRQERRLRRVSE